MKKRLFSILLCVMLVTTMLIGCGSDAGGSSTEGGSTEGASNAESSDTEEDADSSNEGSSASSGSGGQFDDYARPVVKSDGDLTIGVLHMKLEAESQARSVAQNEVEAEQRGWKLIDVTWNSDAEWIDCFRNLMNQGVDAIILQNAESMDAKASVIQEAREKGIGVYNNDNMVVPGVIMNSTMPNGVAAMSLMYQIGNDMNWNGNLIFAQQSTIQVSVERVGPMEAVCGVYPNLSILDTLDVTAGGNDIPTYVADSSKAYFQKYGTDLNGYIGSCDYYAMSVVESAQQDPSLVNPDFFIAGIDGGTDVWNYIRNGGYYKYTYSQPFEMFTHKVWDVVDQIQVQGVNPGDSGCDIAYSGETLYSEGKVVTEENVPEVGVNVNSIFDYYTDDADAWYNWEGTYTVVE